MSIALYMDEQVPLAITNGLRQLGIDVLTVQEDNRSGYADPILLDRATELGRVMFSQDEDLPIEAHHRQAKGINFAIQFWTISGDSSAPNSSHTAWRIIT